MSTSSFSSPLGRNAAVNWVACEDIGRVAAVALLDPSLDGSVLDVTGPSASTLSAGTGIGQAISRLPASAASALCVTSPRCIAPRL